MRLLTRDDIRDIYIKISQRGWAFFLSKFSIRKKSRTQSSFNVTSTYGAHWWTIPKVQERWNQKIYSDPNLNYELYLSNQYGHKSSMNVLSLGSGGCTRELELARLNPNWNILCVDFSDNRLSMARQVAREQGSVNFKTKNADVNAWDFKLAQYDLVLFNSSLHHFNSLNQLLQKVHGSLKSEGHLIIDEFVGATRLQYPQQQLCVINECIRLIPEKFRKIFKTDLIKTNYSGSGWIRMILSDPSECIESARIIPVIHSLFKIVEEKPYGGNLLMPVLKDISHHFHEMDPEKEACLERIFDFEDQYLKSHRSDHMFGVYAKN